MRQLRIAILAAFCWLTQPAAVGPGGATAAAPAAPSVPGPAAPPGGDSFRAVQPGLELRFPADHAAHPAYRTEWWYYTGHLWVVDDTTEVAAAPGLPAPADLGFQLTFFRSGVARPASPRASAWALRDLYFAHLALGEFSPGRFHVAERMMRDALGLAGADSTALRVWIDDWSATRAADGSHRLVAGEPGAHGIELTLVPEKPPALHGDHGLSRKGEAAGQASYYYSFTRLAAAGTVRLGDRTVRVQGEAWMDHEFTTGELAADLAGWDWFGLQLDDGTELMIYLLRRADGTWAPASSGSLVERTGRVIHLSRDAFLVTAIDTWSSPASGAIYPSRWRVRVPPAALDLDLRPRLPDQELVTSESTGVTYWEGAVAVRGTRAGASISGRGFVELTGYATAFRARL
jgi:predicted secreted hydrolase